MKADGGGTGTGMAKGEAGANREEQEGLGSKSRQLVDDVSEYWEFYDRDGTD